MKLKDLEIDFPSFIGVLPELILENTFINSKSFEKYKPILDELKGLDISKLNIKQLDEFMERFREIEIKPVYFTDKESAIQDDWFRTRRAEACSPDDQIGVLLYSILSAYKTFLEELGKQENNLTKKQLSILLGGFNKMINITLNSYAFLELGLKKP